MATPNQHGSEAETLAESRISRSSLPNGQAGTRAFRSHSGSSVSCGSYPQGRALMKIDQTTNTRLCDCESASCHPRANCNEPATVKTIHSTVCAACAAKMPEEYLACKWCGSLVHFSSEHFVIDQTGIGRTRIVRAK